MAFAGYLPDQTPKEQDTTLTYTSNPLALLASDIGLFFSLTRYLPLILLPFRAQQPRDELYASLFNAYDVAFQFVLSLLQTGFVLSILFCFIFGFFISLGWFVVYLVGFVVANYFACKFFFNGRPMLESSKGLALHHRPHPEEAWIFLNGIAVGQHWLQANIDQLSCVFGRRIIGVHNPSAGLVFDLIQCLIQRDFGYATLDVRNAYQQVKNALFDPQYKKVVFIIHSQGAIEGGLIVDWLLDEVPQDMLRQLEVYSFGNAANHFNNPPRRTSSMREQVAQRGISKGLWDGHDSDNRKAIGHIEHYANSGDFVARWGVLHYTGLKRSTWGNGNRTGTVNTFMGRVFVRPGSGHLLNQHYLSTMFTMGRNGKVADHNPFMDMPVQARSRDGNLVVPDGESNAASKGSTARLYDIGTPVETVMAEQAWAEGIDARELKVRDLSRLWLYRNGMSPEDKMHRNGMRPNDKL